MGSDPILDVLWKAVLDRWDEQGVHRAFIEHCEKSDQLVEAAVRYRGMAADHERHEVAQKRLAGIAVLAIAKLETMRTKDPKRPSQAAAYVLITLFIAASIGLAAYLQMQ